MPLVIEGPVNQGHRLAEAARAISQMLVCKNSPKFGVCRNHHDLDHDFFAILYEDRILAAIILRTRERFDIIAPRPKSLDQDLKDVRLSFSPNVERGFKFDVKLALTIHERICATAGSGAGRCGTG